VKITVIRTKGDIRVIEIKDFDTDSPVIALQMAEQYLKELGHQNINIEKTDIQ
jgi:hypothetical protein